MKFAIQSKFKDVETVKKFFHDSMISHMDDEEKARFEIWLKEQKLTQDEWITNLAKNAFRCTKNWDGFLEGSDVLHSDWGFVPKELDEDHREKPDLIFGSDNDDLGWRMNEWLVGNYRNARLKKIHGGHVASLFYMDEIWREMLEMSGDRRLVDT